MIYIGLEWKSLVHYNMSGLPIGPASSTGSPTTFIILPKVSRPTGTYIGKRGLASCGFPRLQQHASIPFNSCLCLVKDLVRRHHTTVEIIISNYHDWRACVDNVLASDKTFCRVHSNGTDSVLSQMLCYLQHQPVVHSFYLERSQDGRKLIVELHINHSSNNLCFKTYMKTHENMSSAQLLNQYHTLYTLAAFVSWHLPTEIAQPALF